MNISRCSNDFWYQYDSKKCAYRSNSYCHVALRLLGISLFAVVSAAAITYLTPLQVTILAGSLAASAAVALLAKKFFYHSHRSEEQKIEEAVAEKSEEQKIVEAVTEKSEELNGEKLNQGEALVLEEELKQYVFIGNKCEISELQLKLEHFLRNLKEVQLQFLTTVDKFWVVIGDSRYCPVAAKALSVEQYAVLVSNSEIDLRRVEQLNEFLKGLNSSDPQFLDKVTALGNSGNPYIHMEAFALKMGKWRDSYRDIQKNWKERSSATFDRWRRESPKKSTLITSAAPPPSPLKKQDQREIQLLSPLPIPQFIPKSWSHGELLKFIRENLGADQKECCFKAFEEMDEDSLSQFVELLDVEALKRYLSFEKIVTNAASSLQKRRERLQLLFSRLNEEQLQAAAQETAFWEVCSDTVNGSSEAIVWALTSSQFKVVVEAMLLNKDNATALAALINKFPIPDQEGHRTVLRERLKSIEMAIKQKKFTTEALLSQCDKTLNDAMTRKKRALLSRGSTS